MRVLGRAPAADLLPALAGRSAARLRGSGGRRNAAEHLARLQPPRYVNHPTDNPPLEPAMSPGWAIALTISALRVVDVAESASGWLLLLSGMCTKADNFQVNYMMELPVEEKALIMCSFFLIDMVYFEVRQDNQS